MSFLPPHLRLGNYTKQVLASSFTTIKWSPNLPSDHRISTPQAPTRIQLFAGQALVFQPRCLQKDIRQRHQYCYSSSPRHSSELPPLKSTPPHKTNPSTQVHRCWALMADSGDSRGFLNKESLLFPSTYVLAVRGLV